MKNADLAALLTAWFDTYDINDHHTLARNEVAKVLKARLKKKDRWKARPRGKPFR